MGTNITEITGGKLYCLDEHGNPIDIPIDFMGIPNITVSREYTGEMEVEIYGRVSNLAFRAGEDEQDEQDDFEANSEALDDFLNQFERK